MAENINEIIGRAAAGSTVVLPSGEFEGPVIINKPLRIIGSNTTLWGTRGAVLEVRTSGVTLENLRVELTENINFDTAVLSNFPCSVKDVEVLGGISGFGMADGYFSIPRTLDLGEFAAEKTNSYTIKLTATERMEIVYSTRDVEFSPNVLEMGENTLSITVSNISAQTLLYTDVLFKGTFSHRVYLTGKPEADISAVSRELTFSAPQPTITPPHSSRYTTEISVPPTSDVKSEKIVLKRGQRVEISKYINDKFSIFFTGEVPYGWELDPYVFLIDENGKALDDTGLVFFGNERSPNGEAVYFPHDGHVEIDLSNVDYRTNKIVLAYSIYAGDSTKNFSHVKNPTVKLRDTQERVSFTMDGLSAETTVVAMEFYRYKGEWKMSAVGGGYADGMAKLCNSFGLEVV